MSIAVGESSTQLAAGTQLVLVRTERDRFAVPASDVIEYVPCGPLFCPPAMHTHIKGFGKHRDRALPIVDLDALGDDPAQGDRHMIRWLIVQRRDGPMILGVRVVIGLSALGSSGADRVPDRPTAIETRFVVDDEPYWIVDCNLLF